jgi:hypothetical protein
MTCLALTLAAVVLVLPAAPPPPLCALVLLQMSCAEGLPAEVTEELLENDDFLQKFHHALLQVSPKP